MGDQVEYLVFVLTRVYGSVMTASMNDQIGQFLYQLRLARDVTQQRLADSIGITVASVSRAENGHTAPRANTLGPWLDALRAVRELSASEQAQCRKLLSMPAGYEYNTIPHELQPFNVRYVDKSGMSYAVAAAHIFDQMAYTVGKRRALEILLDTCGVNRIQIPTPEQG